MFGSSGIRGVVGSEITPELALKFGYAVGVDADNVVVGRDPRLSGPALEDAVVSGVLSAGADVERLGIAPTPAVGRLASDAGIMITASHNPSEYNGFKPMNSDGRGFDEEQRERVLELLEAEIEVAEASEFGSSKRREDAAETHAEEVLGAVSGADLKVVVDGGNGAASNVTPHVLREMGCQVVTLNCQHDGNFPGRPSEPKESNLTDLKNAVKSTDADLGIAHDGDGDRMAAVDENGDFVEPDDLMALFARYESEDTVAAPINTSMVVDSVADVVHTKVGDVNVTNTMKQLGSHFGGEPSNSWIFADETYCPDGVLAAAKVCEMVDALRPLSKLVAELPTYVLRRGNFDCDNDRKQDVMARIVEEIESEYGEYTDIDGVRVDLEEGWFLIRPSGTEPLIRVTAESSDGEKASDLFGEASQIVEEALQRSAKA